MTPLAKNTVFVVQLCASLQIKQVDFNHFSSNHQTPYGNVLFFNYIALNT